MEDSKERGREKNEEMASKDKEISELQSEITVLKMVLEKIKEEISWKSSEMQSLKEIYSAEKKILK